MARKKTSDNPAEGGLATSTGAIGPNIRELARLAGAAEMLHCSATMVPTGYDRLSLGITASKGEGVKTASWLETPDDLVLEPAVAESFEQGMLDLANSCPPGVLLLESVTVRVEGCSLRRAKLLHLALKAWCEAFGVAVPTDESLAEKDRRHKAGLRQIHDEMLEDLRNGPAGVKKWNARTQKVRAKVGPFRKLDVADQVLAGINLCGLDFQESNFDRADLRKARLKETDFRQSSFLGARLDGADLTWAKLAHTDFSGASLVGCKLWGIKNLRGARFRSTNLEKVRFVMGDLRQLEFQGANLSRADLSYCHLQGADFSGANLEGCKLNHAVFDETTRFPNGFALPKGLSWRGQGADPRQPRR
jgi:uncharacterized protein YjbI with pentapeptide repeats